jgi:hypothetical protein
MAHCEISKEMSSFSIELEVFCGFCRFEVRKLETQVTKHLTLKYWVSCARVHRVKPWDSSFELAEYMKPKIPGDSYWLI